MKKIKYSCFVRKGRGEINPFKLVRRWGRNIKYAYQRIRYGYCDRDIWSIDSWFLGVFPNMLEDLKGTTHGYPNTHSVYSHALVGTGAPEKVDEDGMDRWKDILSEMIFLFREANPDTCTQVNKYKEEYDKAFEEFTKKYGLFGEKLLTEDDKRETGSTRWYMLGDVPEYKEISNLYHDECRRIDEYRNECKDKGLDLLKKWFWNLWD